MEKQAGAGVEDHDDNHDVISESLTGGSCNSANSPVQGFRVWLQRGMAVSASYNFLCKIHDLSEGSLTIPKARIVAYLEFPILEFSSPTAY